MVGFSVTHHDITGVKAAVETHENVVQWGPPEFHSQYIMPALIGGAGRDIANPQIPVTPKTITSSDNLNPVSIVATAHGFSTGDQVIINGHATMTEINLRVFTITKVDDNTFTLDGENGIGYTDGTGGTATLVGDSGYLRKGLLMGYHTVNELWLPWTGVQASPPTDGTEVIQGVLSQDTTVVVNGVNTPRFGDLIIWGGPIKASGLIIPGEATPGIAGKLDEAAVRAELFFADNQAILDDYYQQ